MMRLAPPVWGLTAMLPEYEPAGRFTTLTVTVRTAGVYAAFDVTLSQPAPVVVEGVAVKPTLASLVPVSVIVWTFVPVGAVKDSEVGEARIDREALTLRVIGIFKAVKPEALTVRVAV